jgi:3-isopropylmalate/(R)-2-methylmalate dehydratase large subunit
MGHTIAEKILARAAGLASVKAGDEIMAKPDFVLSYDFPGSSDVLFHQVTQDFQVAQVFEPERFGVFIDHMVPAATPAEEELHKNTRAWCAANNVTIYERQGIGHQVASEVGFATPGAFVLHHDGHIAQLGSFGTLAIGVRRNLLEAFVREYVSIKVPKTTRVNLHGTLQNGVMARDVFHHLLRVMGPNSCRFQVLELGGDALSTITIEGLQAITGLAMFVGALTAIVNPDARILAKALSKARKALVPQYSDPDAQYEAVFEIELSKLEPTVAAPPSPSNIKHLSEFIGLEMHSGYLGSCASGRLEDLRAAAQVLAGRKVKSGFALHVVPTSQAILADAAREGLIATLVDAGAFISSSSCDYCYGRIATMSAGQRAVSTGTLNVPGRMGSPDSEIYLVNAAAVAAAAIEGRIVDPRQYIPET